MATTNPLDQFLNLDVDESAISALVGSLESQLASPTSKDSPQQNSSTSVNNNHIDGARVENATSTQSQADNHAGQKPGLLANNSQITISAANGSKDSISQSQLLALNSVAGISIASTNSSQGVTLLSSVNSHSTTSGTATATTNVIGGTHSIPNVKFTTVPNSAIKSEINAISTAASLPKQVIVTVGSTNQGTVVLGTTQTNSVATASITGASTNSVNTSGTTTSIAGNASAIYDLASIAAEQQPLQVPTTTHAKGLRPGQLTVREQLEKQQKDIKPTLTTQLGNVNVSVVNAVQGTNQFTTVKQEPKVKQEVKILSQSPSVPTASQAQTINIVTSAVKSTTGTPNSSGVITLTKQMPNQQTMTVVRPQTAQPGLPPGTQTIQIVNNPRMVGSSPAQQKTLAPRVVSAPMRIVSQQPQVRAQGNVGTVTLPPGLQLPPGTVLVQNEQGQLVFLTGQQGGIQQQATSSAIPGTAAYKLQPVKPGTTQGQTSTGAIQSLVLGGSSVRPQTTISSVAATRPQITTHQQLSSIRYPGSMPPHNPSSPRPPGVSAAQMTSIRPTHTTTRLQTPTPGTQMGVGPPHGLPPSQIGAQLHGPMASTQVTSMRQTAPVMAARLQSPVSKPPSGMASQMMGVPTTVIGNMPTVVSGQATTTGAGLHNVIHTQAAAQLPKGGQVNLALSAAQPQSIIENVKKCKNFLSTLIKLASSQPADTVKNVKNLIQGLIDGKIQPEDFTGKLQVELKSSPQPCLVPFLKKSLPLLRQSMSLNKMQIEGVRPPPLEVVQAGASAVTAAVNAATAAAAVRPIAPQPRHTLQQQTMAAKGLRPGTPQVIYRPQMAHKNQTVNQTKALLTKPQMLPTTVTAIQAQANKSPAQAVQHREKRKYEALNRDDDDINDVATMGGVNLTEESRNILATNSELMSGQLRSCQDESFLATQALLARINERAKKHGLEDTPQEVAQLVSHATQEMLRNMCAKLANIAEHRLEIYKMRMQLVCFSMASHGDSKHEVKNDVKAQLKFLEELDRLEKKRHEEAEREILLRAAKSRSKHEDPEQLKLKEKAKALQQAEMEEVRQREANLTALAAIGPRKKKKLNEDAQPGGSGSSAGGSGVGTGNSPRTSILRPRIKRVNLRDLIFLMEQERESTKSNLLYRTYLK